MVFDLNDCRKTGERPGLGERRKSFWVFLHIKFYLQVEMSSRQKNKAESRDRKWLELERCHLREGG